MMNIDFEAIRKKRDAGWHDLVTNPDKNGAILSGYYSESNHFIYELLQNAEDANATKVYVEYHKDRIEFYHDGDPFNEGDVYRITDVLNSIKKEQGEDIQKIGHFGIGFKAVFKYTLNPRIYSDHTAFEIRNYLMPYEIEDNWDYQKTTVDLSFGPKDERPFLGSEHLTRIVIPFKKNMIDSCIEGSSSHIIEKLKGLNGETLIFLNHVRKLYWVDKRNTQDHALVSTEILSGEISKNCVVRCKVSSAEGEHFSDYVHFNKTFKKTIHCDKDDKCSDSSGTDEDVVVNVAIAYIVNKKTIVAEKDKRIYVFFPTLEQSCYPFLAHGSFETELSREKIAKDSQFNSDIWNDLRKLICESLVTLRDIGFITQPFIKDVLIPSMTDIKLKTMITDLFLTEKMLPDADNNYQYSKDLLIPVPFEMANLRNNKLFGKPLQSINKFVSLNDLNREGSGAYFDWLLSDLKIPTYHMSDWVTELVSQPDATLDVSADDDELLMFYDFMQSRTVPMTYRAGRYAEEYHRKSHSMFDSLKNACVVLNADNRLIRPFYSDRLQIYISAESKYGIIAGTSIIHPALIEKYADLWSSLDIVSFDDLRYLKETMIPRYSNLDNLSVHERTYVFDFRLILEIIKKYDASQLPAELRTSFILRGIPINSTVDEVCMCKPCDVFSLKTKDGTDLLAYLGGLKFKKYIIDESFYMLNHIDLPASILEKIGVQSDIVHLGTQIGKDGRAEIRALGDYCPWIDIDYFFSNVNFILSAKENMISTAMQSAQKKSKIMLELLLKYNTKFKGKIMRGKVNGTLKEDRSEFFEKVCKMSWLFDRNMNLITLDSNYNDLNSDIYYGLDSKYPKDAFRNLGLIDNSNLDLSMIKTLDDKRIAIQKIMKESKSEELSVLVGELLNDLPADQLDILDDKLIERRQNEIAFDPENCSTNEFPKDNVKNPDRLRDSVLAQIYISDPVKYEMKIRSIRTSKIDARHVIKTEYTNDSGIVFCQCCRKSISAPEVVEIKNTGLELYQMHICLCSECANKYRYIRDKNADVEQLWLDAVLKSDMSCEDEEGGYPVMLCDGMTVYFTQHHLLEIKTIFELPRVSK